MFNKVHESQVMQIKKELISLGPHSFERIEDLLWGKDPKLYVDGLNINRSKSSNLSLLFTKNV